jgi:hypothetical protein
MIIVPFLSGCFVSMFRTLRYHLEWVGKAIGINLVQVVKIAYLALIIIELSLNNLKKRLRKVARRRAKFRKDGFTYLPLPETCNLKAKPAPRTP